MRSLQSVKSFYKEYAYKLPAKQAILNPVIVKTSLLSSFLAYPFASEKLSRNIAKHTTLALASRIPAFVTKQYHIWCQKQANASMEKLQPLLSSNPYLSHTLLLLAATHDPNPGTKLRSGIVSIYHFATSILKQFNCQIPQIPFFNILLEKSCQEQKEQITEHAILPLVENTYRKLLKRLVINACCLANLALVSSLFSFTLSKIVTPAQLEMRNNGITALRAFEWGIKGYLYAPLVYHGIKVIPEIWTTYQATKTYEKKLDFLYQQIESHPNRPKLPKASIQAIAILLATIY